MENPATCIAACAFFFVIFSWLKYIKPGYVRWLSFLIAPDGIITNGIVILIIITWIFFLLHYISLLILYFNVSLYFTGNFYFSTGIAIFLFVFERNSKTT